MNSEQLMTHVEKMQAQKEKRDTIAGAVAAIICLILVAFWGVLFGSYLYFGYVFVTSVDRSEILIDSFAAYSAVLVGLLFLFICCCCSLRITIENKKKS